MYLGDMGRMVSDLGLLMCACPVDMRAGRSQSSRVRWETAHPSFQGVWVKRKMGVGRTRWDKWRWPKMLMGPDNFLRNRKRSTEAEASTGDGAPFQPDSAPPWCNSNFRWRNDGEILRKLGRRMPTTRVGEAGVAGLH